jgi:hypothetical protein
MRVRLESFSFDIVRWEFESNALKWKKNVHDNERLLTVSLVMTRLKSATHQWLTKTTTKSSVLSATPSRRDQEGLPATRAQISSGRKSR